MDCLKHRAADRGIGALLAMAVLRYSLMVLVPQQEDKPMVVNSFSCPSAAVASGAGPPSEQAAKRS